MFVKKNMVGFLQIITGKQRKTNFEKVNEQKVEV